MADDVKPRLGSPAKRVSFPASKPDSVLPENLEDLRCSFCLKSQAIVRTLITNASDSPSRAFICDECIAVCQFILEEDPK